MMYSKRPLVSGAFTLVEVLVSLTVLSLIVLLVSSITGSASKSVNSGQKRLGMNSDARLVFSRIETDLAQMIKRSDLTYEFKTPSTLMGNTNLGVNDQMAFLATVPGLFTTQPTSYKSIANASLIAYILREDRPFFKGLVFERLAKGLLWSEIPYSPTLLTGASGSKFPDLMPSPTVTDINTNYDDYYQVIGSTVFRFEYTYLLKATDTAPAVLSTVPWRNGSSIDGFKEVAAIVVGLALLDADGRAKISTYDDLVKALPNAVDGQDVVSSWVPLINGGGLGSSAGIPESVANSIKVYQRYFYLNSGTY